MVGINLAATMQALILGLAVIAGLLLLAVILYNRLLQLRVQADGAWADIDVQLKRRHDLVPNLVETVQGYAGYEQKTLNAVIQARGVAMAARTPAQQQKAEQQLAASLGQLFALAEAYPELKAVASFCSLQDSLAEIEEALQNSRRYYNAVVRDLNTAIAIFPSNLVAAICGIQPYPFFLLGEAAEAAVPQVSFDA